MIGGRVCKIVKRLGPIEASRSLPLTSATISTEIRAFHARAREASQQSGKAMTLNGNKVKKKLVVRPQRGVRSVK
jgi:hypothetical protein